MKLISIEIKARVENLGATRKILKARGAIFKGVDIQTDTYFKVGQGRLKLREGKIENALIYYNRENKSGPKQSDVSLIAINPLLKKALFRSLDVLVIVRKRREIYFINNVKFNLDKVRGLGNFVEIEAISKDGVIGKKKLREQCEYFLGLLRISKKDLVPVSYSDLLLRR